MNLNSCGNGHLHFQFLCKCSRRWAAHPSTSRARRIDGRQPAPTLSAWPPSAAWRGALTAGLPDKLGAGLKKLALERPEAMRLFLR